MVLLKIVIPCCLLFTIIPFGAGCASTIYNASYSSRNRYIEIAEVTSVLRKLLLDALCGCGLQHFGLVGGGGGPSLYPTASSH
jgi:hypothetical protein